ncbi:hypothetical protein AYO21_03331 [Fonsecaea monophora]|uniref:DNA-directed RNA polymerase III subunit RPC4 n=1 Tax=Fonsecaea monophora TaxID=254056 RepID=A0A177FDY5_9EURO|nr:hypothetical protein AYO21_03331 [Fonsecaea monophora]KAH0842954.1 hypothetical protein FOPE_07996 [Fonsecaea pedrosoi]OAG42455.1 hypothetical protein AYO21_03331 [Fonsecaea monophora]
MSDGTSSTPPTANARSTPRGGGTAAAARPRPRAGIQRKTKAEREQFAKEEAERQKARAAEQEAANRGARGGRGASRGGRGSSAATSQREEPVGAGGIFGAGSTARISTRPRTSYEGYGELLESGVRGGLPEDALEGASASGRATTAGRNGTGHAGTSAGGRGGISGTTGEVFDAATDEEPDDDRKRDIELIMISSDDDEDMITSSSRKGKQKTTGGSKGKPRRALGLRPVRAPRADKEAEGQEGDTARVRSKTSRPAMGQKSDGETQDVDSRSDRDDDTEDADNDSLQFVKEQPSSPEMRKRTLKKQLGAAGRIGRDIKSHATETAEERAERIRAMQDVQKLRDLFVTAPPATGVKMEVDEDEGKSSSEESSEEVISKIKDGKMFLFQLPPLTPFLVDSATTQPHDGGVKVEPGTDGSATAVDLNVTNTNAAAAAGDPDGLAKATRPDLQMDGLLTAAEPTRLPAGIVGKLRVHKSGKVTLDWGGTDMEVRYGSEVSFLQDVVLVEPRPKQEDAGDGGDGHENGGGIGGSSGDEDHNKAEDEEKKDIRGTVYALGPVRRKMVLIPDWVKLYD